jgi:hypothetical protein
MAEWYNPRDVGGVQENASPGNEKVDSCHAQNGQEEENPKRPEA